MISAFLAFSTLALAVGPAPSPAAAPPPNAVSLGPVLLTSGGEVRAIGSLPPALTLDASGTALGQGPVLDTRVRLSLDVRSARKIPTDPTFQTSWDLFSGQLAGDTWDVPGTLDERHREDLGVLDAGSVLPRKAAGAVQLGPVQVFAGLTTSHWGLGMLANDGEHDPEFGRSDFGDRVLRLRLATRPFQEGGFPLTFLLAGDRVVQDDLVHEGALGPAGQVAWQGVAAALWTPKSGNKLGIYGVYRDQAEPLVPGEAERRTTRLGVVDVYGEARLPFGALQLRTGAEAAEVYGHTTRSETYNSLDGLDLISGGATGYLGLAGPARVAATAGDGAAGSPRRDLWSAKVRMGWASGDSDPDDAVSGDFTFDRDHDAGMLLFDEQMGAIEAANYALISDPANTGHTPDGAELTVTEGSFRRATFVQPVVNVEPLPWLGLRAGVMAAWSTAPIAQSFYTFRNGGTPTNYLDQPTSGRALGTEVDWAVRVGAVALGSAHVKVRPELLVQGAHLFGAPDMGGVKATMLTGTVRARW